MKWFANFQRTRNTIKFLGHIVPAARKVSISASALRSRVMRTLAAFAAMTMLLFIVIRFPLVSYVTGKLAVLLHSVSDPSQATLLFALTFVAAVSVLLLWLIPKWQTASLKLLAPEIRFDKENESRKTLAQILGGLFVIGSLFSTARTLQLSQQQTAVALKQAAVAAEQVEVTREGEITDRFTKAIDQLSNRDKLEVRLGGIYALERIARDSQFDHWQVIEVLTTYVKENSPVEFQKPHKPVGFNHNARRTSIKTDIQAILTVLGRRSRVGETLKLDLSTTDLHGADLSDLDLQGTNFFRSDLHGAILQRTNLKNTNLSECDLSQTFLTDAVLTGADLTFSDLSYLDLSGANLSHANLTAASLTAANMGGTDLTQANLKETRIERVWLDHVVGLSQAQIQQANGDLTTHLALGLVRPPSWR